MHPDAVKRWRHPNGYDLITRTVVADPPIVRGMTEEEEARIAFEMTSPAARFAAAAFTTKTPDKSALH